MTIPIPPNLLAEISALPPGIPSIALRAGEAFPENYLLLHDRLAEDPEYWPLFLHLGADTRCPKCEGNGQERGRLCTVCAGWGEIVPQGGQP